MDKSFLSTLSYWSLPAWVRVKLHGAVTPSQWNGTGHFERWHILRRAFND